jgi:cyclase
VLVDAGLAGTSEKVLAAVKTISDKPIRAIIDTHVHPDHVGGNQALSTSGGFASGGTTGGGRRDAIIYSHENVLLRMSGTLGKEKPLDTGLWPGNTFFNGKKELFVNGEAIEILYQPAAHTDGDAIVFFRRSDVVSTGDIFVMDSFPMIDRARGGTIDGLIAALNTILDIVIPAPTQERGTMIVPGHGRLADEHDLLEYRDMVTILRNRIQKMIDKGMTLDQVRAARPVFEYEPRWGAETGAWTTTMFVEAVYNSLKDAKGPLSLGEGR